MKDLTEHLKEIKVKSVGFDIYNEEACLKALGISANVLKYMDNPSLDIQYAAVDKWGVSVIKRIKNPSEEIQLAVVNSNGRMIQYIDNPTNDVVISSIKQDMNSIKFIDLERLSKETKEVLMFLL